MQFNNDNTEGYTEQQVEIMNAALYILAKEHPDWTRDYLCDQVKKVWVSDDRQNTAEKLIERVDREQILASKDRM